MVQVREVWCAVAGCLLLGASALGVPITDKSAFAPGVSTTIDFETDGSGSDVDLIAGEVRLLPAGEYSGLGVTFSQNINWVRDGNAAFQAALFLGGSPRNGIPSAAVDQFEVIFTDPVQGFGFFVVYNSDESATGPTFTAFDEGGNVIESVTFSTTVPGGGMEIPNATFVKYNFLGIDAGTAIIKRVLVTKSAAVLDDLTFAETLVEPQGACCLESVLRETIVTCQDDVLLSDCLEMGGTFAGDGTLCEDINCEDLIPTGACCMEQGNGDLAAACLDDLTAFECETMGGTYAGDDTLCENVNCDEILELGACCFEVFQEPDLAVTCDDGLTEDECLQLGGVFNGIGTTCLDTDCGEVLEVGACCFGTFCEDEITEETCVNEGGEFQGVGTDCTGNPCDTGELGACCFSDGTCEELTESTCLAMNGTFRGEGTTCADGACLGACCVNNGTECIDGIDIATCEIASEGVFQGFGVPCSESECVGACCVGACMCVAGVDQVTCEVELEGTYAGNMTDCEDLSICAPACADANGDGRVDSIDLGILLAEFNQPESEGPFQADFNCDGRVDSIDLGILLSQFNLSCDQVINGDRSDARHLMNRRMRPVDDRVILRRGDVLRGRSTDYGSGTSEESGSGASGGGAGTTGSGATRR